MKDIYQRLKKIPSMGAHKIADWLIDCAAAVPEGCSIVEVGSWLGAGAGYMALSAPDRIVHVFDRFRASSSEVKKAAATGVTISGDTLPLVSDHLKGLDNILLRQGDIKAINWHGRNIGLYVDDASKTPDKWIHVVKEFFPSLVPGAILILMDYNYYKTSGKAAHKCQLDFMRRNRNYFTLLKESATTSAAMFRLERKYDLLS